MSHRIASKSVCQSIVSQGGCLSPVLCLACGAFTTTEKCHQQNSFYGLPVLRATVCFFAPAWFVFGLSLRDSYHTRTVRRVRRSRTVQSGQNSKRVCDNLHSVFLHPTQEYDVGLSGRTLHSELWTGVAHPTVTQRVLPSSPNRGSSMHCSGVVGLSKKLYNLGKTRSPRCSPVSLCVRKANAVRFFNLQ